MDRGEWEGVMSPKVRHQMSDPALCLHVLFFSQPLLHLPGLVCTLVAYCAWRCCGVDHGFRALPPHNRESLPPDFGEGLGLARFLPRGK